MPRPTQVTQEERADANAQVAGDPTTPPDSVSPTPDEIMILNETTGSPVTIPMITSVEELRAASRASSSSRDRSSSKGPSPPKTRSTARKSTSGGQASTRQFVPPLRIRLSPEEPATTNPDQPGTSTASVQPQLVDPPLQKGEYIVEKIVTHQGEPPHRQFRIKWDDGSCTWERETKRLEKCATSIQNYCRDAEITMTKLVDPDGGYAGQGEIVEENHVKIHEVVEKSIQFGNRDGLQPQAFDVSRSLKPEDAIYIRKIGGHYFTVLYIHSRKLALATDGVNCYATDKLARETLRDDFPGIKIQPIEYVGQRYANHCGTSAAAAAIEMQRYYKLKQLPRQIVPPKSIIERIATVLHKEPEAKITPWEYVTRYTGISCDKCGVRFPHAKNRRCLSLHKCQE